MENLLKSARPACGAFRRLQNLLPAHAQALAERRHLPPARHEGLQEAERFLCRQQVQPGRKGGGLGADFGWRDSVDSGPPHR